MNKNWLHHTSAMTKGAMICILVFANVTQAFANPQGGVVTSGSATITSSGNRTDIHQSTNKAVIDWRSFDIAPDETTQFHQPSSSSMTLNRINSGSPSQILGTLKANGNILILNGSGVLFGAGSQVDVGGLVATTSGISNKAFMKDGKLRFNKPGDANASIINQGTITARNAGLVGLVAPNVENNGIITANLGKVHLASADDFTMDLYGDGLMNFKASGDIKKQLISNKGTIEANGGTIALTAAAGREVVDSLITVSGELKAPAVAAKNGTISIFAAGSNAVAGNKEADKGKKSGSSGVVVDGTINASGAQPGEKGGNIDIIADNVIIKQGADIKASGATGGGNIRIGGDYQGKGSTATAKNVFIEKNTSIKADAIGSGDGGRVIVWADNSTNFYGNISVTGGAASGNGGFVEVSGKEYLNYRGFVDTTAANGETGLLFLDPADIVILSGSGDSAADGTGTFAGDPSGSAGTILSGDAGPSTIYESELEGIAALTNISLAATNSITINDLADNNLNLAQTAGRTVTLNAASVNMLDHNDTITTAGGALTINTSASSILGNVNTNGGLVTLNVGGASDFTVAGVISGSGGLYKNGTGTLTLNGLNTYSGLTTIQQGSLIASTNTAFGSSTVRSNNGSTVITALGNLTWANDFTLNSNLAILSDSSLVLDGNISTISGSRILSFTGTGDATVNGVISNGTGTSTAITRATNGTLTLTNANTYTGNTTVGANATLILGNDSAIGSGLLNMQTSSEMRGTGGTRTIGNNIATSSSLAISGSTNLIFNGLVEGASNRTFTINNSGTTTFAGGISLASSAPPARTLTFAGTGNVVLSGVIADGAGPSNVTFNGSGIYTLSAANTYSGTTTISGTSAIVIGNSAAFGTSALNASGGTLAGDGNAHIITNALTITSGGIMSVGGSSDLTFTSSIAGAAGARSINVTNSALTTFSGDYIINSSGSTRVLTFEGNGNVVFSGVISNGTAAGNLTKNGSGTLTLSGANTYTGVTTINEGSIVYGTNDALSTGNISIQGGTLNIGTYLDSVGSVTLGSGAIIGTTGVLSSTSVFSLQDGTVTANLGGAANLTKSGAGTVILSGNNTYSGTTSISGGTLQLGHSGALSTSSVTLTGGGILDIGAYTTSALGGLTLTSGSIIGGGTITVNGAIGLVSGTISANIAGTGAAAKTGSTTTVTLSGNNTFNGDFNLSQGTLVIGSNTALGAGNFRVTGTSEIQGDGTARTVSNTFLKETANINIAGTSDLTFSGNFINNSANGTVITSSSSGLTTFGSMTIVDGVAARTLTFTGTGNFVVSGVIQNGGGGSGGLVKSGTGSLTLSGANTHTTSTTLSSGTLLIGNNSALGAGTFVLDAGTVQGVGAGSYTVGNAITLTNNATIAGNAALDFSGALTLSATRALTVNNTALTTFGQVQFNGPTSMSLTFTGPGDVTFSGNITKPGAGAGALYLNGSGTYTLLGANTSGANTYFGAGGGTLRIGHNNALFSALFVQGGKIEAFGGDRTLSQSLYLSASAEIIGTHNLSFSYLSNQGNYTLTSTSSGLTNFNSAELANFTARTLTLGGTGNFNITGAITQGSAVGSLVKTGSGTLTTNGTNTYTGSTTVSDGTLVLNGGNGIANTAELILNGANAKVQLGANETIGGLSGTAGEVILGPRTLTVSQAGNTAYDGILSGTGSLIKSGSGTLTLTGANTHSGGTTLTAGGITIGNNAALGTGALTLNGGTLQGSGVGSYTLGNTISLANNSAITGTAALSFTGPMTVTNGRALTVTNTALTSFGDIALSNATGTSLIWILGTGDITFNGVISNGAGFGHLSLDGSGTYTLLSANTQSGNIYFGLSGGTLRLGHNGSGGAGLMLQGGKVEAFGGDRTLSGLFQLGGNTEISGTHNLSFSTLRNMADSTLTSTSSGLTTFSGAFLANGAVTRTLTLGGAGNFNFTAAITDGGGGATGNNLVKTGSGTVTTNGINTYTGSTTVSNGTLILNGGNGIADTTALILNGANAKVQLGANETIGSLSGTAGEIILGTRTLTVAQAGNTTYNGFLSGTGGLTKSGVGTLTLGGANTYTGFTAINGGTLALGADNVLSTGAITLAANTTLDIGSHSDTVGAITISGTGATITGTTGILTPDNIIAYGGDQTISAILAGTGSLIKASSGILTLTRANTFSGGVFSYSDTTIRVGNDAALGTGTLRLSNGTLRGDGTERTLSNNISLTESSTISGNSALILTGHMTNNNASTNITLTINNSALTTFNSFDLSSSADARTVTLAGNGNTRFTGVIANGGGSTSSLIKNGTGTLTLAAQNTFTGGLTIGHTGGTVAYATNNALADTLNIAMDQNTTLDIGAYSDTVGNISAATGASTPVTITGTSGVLSASSISFGAGNQMISAILGGTGSVTKATSGTMTLTRANTYSGGTTLTAGTVRIGNNSALGTGVIRSSNAWLQGDGLGSYVLDNAVNMIPFTKLNLNGDSALTFTNDLSCLNGNCVITSNATALMTFTNVLMPSIGAYTLTVDGTGDTAILGTLSGTGSSLTKQGSGMLTLGGTNTYTGTTTVAGGTLRLSGGNAIVDTGAVVIADDASAILQLQDSETIGALSGGGTTGGAINLGANTLTFSNATTTSFNGSISGTGGITKTGSGAFTLGRANTYTGATTINNGRLILGASNVIADGSALIIGASGIFDMNGRNETVASVSNSGSVRLGGGTLTSTGSQTHTGTVGSTTASGLASTGGGSITANNALNDFIDDLTISTTGDVSIVDANSLSLGTSSANTLAARALGGNLTLNGEITGLSTSGSSIVLTTSDNFVNNAGANALQAAGGSRWLVYSTSPLTDQRGLLSYDFKQYNAHYGDVVLGAGSGFLYALAPTVSVDLTGSVTKTYDGSLAATLDNSNYDVTGAVDGDDISFTVGGTATYDNANAGSGKTVSISGLAIDEATNGAIAVYGYQLSSGSISGAIGEIDKADITVRANDVTKTYDGTDATAGNGFTVTSGTLYTNASNGDVLDSLSGGTYVFTDVNAGTGNKTVTLGGMTVNDGNGGGNYNVTYLDSTASTINRAGLTVTADIQSKIAGAADPLLSYTHSGLAGTDNDSVFSGALARAAGETAGVYAINQGSLSAGGNYTITFVGNDLTITNGGPGPGPGPNPGTGLPDTVVWVSQNPGTDGTTSQEQVAQANGSDETNSDDGNSELNPKSKDSQKRLDGLLHIHPLLAKIFKL